MDKTTVEDELYKEVQRLNDELCKRLNKFEDKQKYVNVKRK